MKDTPPQAELEINAGSPGRPVRGLLAMLDALGARQFTDVQLAEFVEARSVFMAKVDQQVANRRIDRSRLEIFTFNDTIMIVYLAHGDTITLGDLKALFERLREFMVHFLEKSIFFRGSVAAGEFYRVHSGSNTVMGPVVSDAAEWYERGDWIGIHATPSATMLIDSLLEQSDEKLTNLIVPYPVPLKGGASIELKVLNWPKGFYVSGIRPVSAIGAKPMLLSFLSKRPVPPGSEPKYINTLAFYDHVMKSGHGRPTRGAAK